jgi:type I restriction enzyme S subunit
LTPRQAQPATLFEAAEVLQEVEAQPKRWNPYPDYRPCGMPWLGDLPNHWITRKLKFVADVRTSNVDKKSKDDEDEVSLCNYVDVYYNDYITDAIEFMKATASADQIDRFTLRTGDVLITKDSETWDDIAVPSCVDEELHNVLCGYHLALIRPHSATMHGEFLFRAFGAFAVRDQFRVRANGVTRFGLPRDGITSAIFPVPPRDEQEAIAAFLRQETTTIDALVEKRRRLIDLLKEKRTALISHAVTKGLNPDAPMKRSGITLIGNMPSHWKCMRLKFLGTAIIGLTYSPNDIVSEGNGTLVLRANNIQNDRITLGDGVYVNTPIPRELIARQGDILVCSRNGSRRLVGKSGLIDFDREDVSFGAFTTVFRGPLNKFLRYVFCSGMITRYAGLYQTSTIFQLTTRILHEFWIAVPPDNEQDEIASYLEQELPKIDSLIDRARLAISKLDEYRSALISAAVTGKIDVRGEVGFGKDEDPT